jgi:predicted transposase YdaD
MASKPFDPTFKALVELGPGDWPVLFGLTPAPTDIIDADIATVSGAADKALRVRAEPPYLLHLEFVSGHDAATLPSSLHLRHTLLDHRHGLLVRTAVVLLRPEAHSPVLTGKYIRAFPGQRPHLTFGYQVLRVWQAPPERFLSGGLGTLPLAPISAVTERELPGIIRQMEARLSGRQARGLAESLWSATYILMGLRYSRELARQLLQGVRSMRESVTYQAILEEGEAKGAVAEAKKFILLQGSSRLGAPDGATKAALERLDDVQRLEELGVRLLTATSWRELLDRPASRRRPGRRPSS